MCIHAARFEICRLSRAADIAAVAALDSAEEDDLTGLASSSIQSWSDPGVTEVHNLCVSVGGLSGDVIRRDDGIEPRLPS